MMMVMMMMMMMMMMMVIIIIIARDISGESINFQRIYPSFQYTDFDDMHVISNAPVVRLPCVLCRDDRRNASGCLNHYGRRTSIANRKRFVWKGSGRGGGALNTMLSQQDGAVTRPQ